MSDEDALLAAIVAHPDEDTPRLMYADWLQENGRPLRGEFIRVQIELARLELLPRPELDRHVDLFRRNHDLIEGHRAELIGGAVPGSAEVEFRRGFVSEVTVTYRALVNYERALVETRPRPRIILSDSPSLVAEFFRRPPSIPNELISAIRTRPDGDVYSFPLTPLDLSAQTWPQLNEVDVSGCGLGDERLLALLRTWSFPVLTNLDLSGNALTDAAVDSLLDSDLPRQLKRLVLGGNDITDAGAVALAERWPTGADDRLEHLNLKFAPVGQPGQSALLSRFGGRLELF